MNHTSTNLNFTGLDALSGEPLIPPLTEAELFQAVSAERDVRVGVSGFDPQVSRDLHLKDEKDEGKLGLPGIYSKEHLSSARWGLLYPEGLDPQVLEALQPLVQHRCGEMYAIPTACLDDPARLEKILFPVKSSQQDDADAFRTAHMETSGDVDPNILPYYLLIVGSPATPGGISFNFQQRLGDVRPVGRLCFTKSDAHGNDVDDADAYHGYAQSVIEHEQGLGPARQRQAAFFPVAIDKDTQKAAQILAGGVADFIKTFPVTLPGGPSACYQVDTASAGATTRQALLDRLRSPAALLFTSSHGLSYPHDPTPGSNSFAIQQRRMGALVCSERQGKSGPVDPADCFSGDDVPTNLDLGGLVIFTFACHSAGVPQLERFASYYPRLPRVIAGHDFVSRLPQRLLAQGALACIGHVDKTWAYSFLHPQIGQDVKTINFLIGGILSGLRIGQAFESLTNKYLELNSRLYGNQNLFESYEDGKSDEADILHTWMASRDARAYLILGDPAVRLYPERLAAVS
jgi:hypothetical protein